MIPMSGVNSVATSVMGAWSRYETMEINGISHFLEHMCLKARKSIRPMEDV